jgi:hypothetical protein
MHKETGARYERLLQDADLAMEKVSPLLSRALPRDRAGS